MKRITSLLILILCQIPTILMSQQFHVIGISEGEIAIFDITHISENNGRKYDYGSINEFDITNLNLEIAVIDKNTYSCKINNIKNTKLLLWSEKIICDIRLIFKLKDKKIEVISNDKEISEKLKKDIIKKLDLNDLGEFESLFYSPGVLYEAYFEPYLEQIFLYVNTNIKNETRRENSTSFSDTIPAIRKLECKLDNKFLNVKDSLYFNKVEVSNTLFDKEFNDYIKRGVSEEKAIKYMERKDRSNMNFLNFTRYTEANFIELNGIFKIWNIRANKIVEYSKNFPKIDKFYISRVKNEAFLKK